MKKSTITIDVELGDDLMPENITWDASDNITDRPQKAKAMILSFWSGEEKTVLRIDLWAKKMTFDEMNSFFHQTMMTMADTYERATHYTELVNDMKKFAHEFHQKARTMDLAKNKA